MLLLFEIDYIKRALKENTTNKFILVDVFGDGARLFCTFKWGKKKSLFRPW